MAVRGAQQRIISVIHGWQEVEIRPHRYGGLEFRLGKRELGHVHGDALVDIPFPKAVRDEIVAAGQAEPHHILPNSGWVSLFLRSDEDVERAIGLLERSLELAREHRKGATAARSADAVTRFVLACDSPAYCCFFLPKSPPSLSLAS